jgi:hypothetical protein
MTPSYSLIRYACTGWNACIQCFAPNYGRGAANSSGCTKVGVGPYFSEGGLPSLRRRMATNRLGWSLYHNYVCPKSKMWRENGGSFDGVSTERGEYKLPVAEQSEAFYRALFSEGAKQGMLGTELDYQSTDYAMLPMLRTNATYGEAWLHGLNDAALALRQPILWCMSLPRFILSALTLPAVSSARASGDFQESDGNLVDFGPTSLLYWSLGIPPSKDGFWSTSTDGFGPSQPDPGVHPWGAWGGPQQTSRHPNPTLHTIVAAFSMGPVGLEDNARMSHAANVKAICMADGTLLQPSRPLFPIDATHARDPSRRPDGHVWGSLSLVITIGSAPTRFHYVLGFALRRAYSLRASDLHPGFQPGLDHVHLEWVPASGVSPREPHTAGRWALASASSSSASSSSSSSPIWPAGREHGPAIGSNLSAPGSPTLYPNGSFSNGTYPSSLHAFAPILPLGFILLGEASKWVAVSPDRFSELSITNDGALEVRVAGAPDERVGVTVGILDEGGGGVTAAEHTVRVPKGGEGFAMLRVDRPRPTRRD